MALLAQISDAHLIELDPWARDPADWVRLAFLSSYRPSRAESRVRNLARAFQRARRAGADHVVFTGDLTEDADPAQFALFARVVGESGFTPAQVTVIPGNHDAYRGRCAYAAAAQGPLAAVAGTSGASFDLDGVTVVPLDSTLDQHFVRAAGRLGAEQRRHLTDLSRPTLVLQHHPAIPHSPRGLGLVPAAGGRVPGGARRGGRPRAVRAARARAPPPRSGAAGVQPPPCLLAARRGGDRRSGSLLRGGRARGPAGRHASASGAVKRPEKSTSVCPCRIRR